MSMRPIALGGMALLLLLGLSPGPAAADEPQAATTTEAAAVPSCGDCHDQAQAFTRNPHARAEVKKGEAVPNAVCESCHGSGAAHIEAGGDKTLITKPAGLAGANICLKCHNATTDRKSPHAGMHANSAAVNCLSCHKVHNDAAALLAKPQLALCSGCHATQVTTMRSKPYAHRVGRAGFECSTCHEPHGRPGRESLRQTAAGEMPCLGCHSEVRGPHVFEHGGNTIGDCTNCHEVHGSSNPKQLKRATEAQLCLECHSPIAGGTLGSQPPSFHNISLARYQNCTTCHVMVHGSNRSPQLLK